MCPPGVAIAVHHCDRQSTSQLLAGLLCLGRLWLPGVGAQGTVTPQVFIGSQPLQLTADNVVGTISPFPEEYESEISISRTTPSDLPSKLTCSEGWCRPVQKLPWADLRCPRSVH